MLLKNYSATFYPKVARFRIKNSPLFKAKVLFLGRFRPDFVAHNDYD